MEDPEERRKRLRAKLEAEHEAEMQRISRETAEMITTINHMVNRTHAGSVMVNVAAIEELLQRLIISDMRPLSANLTARLFKGYGPISTLSSKIDIAYAMSLLTREAYDTLRTIKDVRNEFAHAKEPLTFNHPTVRALVKKLPKYSIDEKCADFFFGATKQAISSLATLVSEYEAKRPA